MSSQSLTIPFNFQDNFEIDLDRIKIRLLQRKDVNEIYEMYSDTDAMRYRSNSPLKSIREAEDFIKQSIHEKSVRPGIELKPEKKIIGSVLWKINKDDENEVGYSIGKRYWNYGFATEAMKGWTNFITSLIMDNLYATVHSKNVASINVLRKLNFEFVSENENKILKYVLKK